MAAGQRQAQRQEQGLALAPGRGLECVRPLRPGGFIPRLGRQQGLGEGEKFLVLIGHDGLNRPGDQPGPFGNIGELVQIFAQQQTHTLAFETE